MTADKRAMTGANPGFPRNLETERLRLRPYEAADVSWFTEMCLRNRAHLARYESENIVMMVQDEEAAARLIDDLQASWTAGQSFFIGVFRRETGEFVAQVYVGLSDRDLPEYAVGYFVDVYHQGKGYVSEAVTVVVQQLFDQLEAVRIRLECDDTNVRSWLVAERCGFRREGHLRQNKRGADGAICGTYLYGMLRSDHQR